MTTNRDIAQNHPITTSLENLSHGVDRILKRWSAPKKPDKLALLNDLAEAIRSGANWGTLKHSTSQTMQQIAHRDNAPLIPQPSPGAKTLPARLFEIESKQHDTPISELTQDARPLFGLCHNGDPIIGLELSVFEGNGYCDVSIFTRFILLRDDKVVVASVNAWEMAPEIGQLVFLAVQNLQYATIYPAFAQADCTCLKVILGPCEVVAALPEALRYGIAKTDMPSQGVRILFDRHDDLSTSEIDTCLRLVSASLPHLELELFSETVPMQFRISQPRMGVWKPVKFDAPSILDDRFLFRPQKGREWARDGDFLYKSHVHRESQLGEALDLALALVDIDDPNLYLLVSLTPAPKTPAPKLSGIMEPGWHGGLVAGWKVLKLKVGAETQVLSLDAETQTRLEAGLNGWAKRNGHSIETDKTKAVVEALVARAVHRSSHDLEEVRVLMDSATAR